MDLKQDTHQHQQVGLQQSEESQLATKTNGT